MSQELTQIAFDDMEPFELEGSDWASQEDVDCPLCAHRYYFCVCERVNCDCLKCQQVD